MSTKEALQDRRIQEVTEANGRGSVVVYAKWESGRVTKQIITVVEGMADKSSYISQPTEIKPNDLKG